MAKIIKVGSQNPTFTTVKAKKGAIKTQRNSNEVTNPFKFTNFEGNTLQFADVFEGFKPSFKATPANKMRMIASSAVGSMSKVKSLIPESIVNFVNRVTGYASSAWNYAKVTPFTVAMSDAATSIKDSVSGTMTTIKESKTYKAVADALTTDIELNINLPEIKALSTLKEGMATRMEAMHEGIAGIGSDMKSRWESLVAMIPSRTRYTENTPVSELEAAWININALEGGNV